MNEPDRPSRTRSDPPGHRGPPPEAPARRAWFGPRLLATMIDGIDDVGRPVVETWAIAQGGVLTSQEGSRTSRQGSQMLLGLPDNLPRGSLG
jgi:hypothetical protein